MENEFPNVIALPDGRTQITCVGLAAAGTADRLNGYYTEVIVACGGDVVVEAHSSHYTVVLPMGTKSFDLEFPRYKVFPLGEDIILTIGKQHIRGNLRSLRTWSSSELQKSLKNDIDCGLITPDEIDPELRKLIGL